MLAYCVLFENCGYVRSTDVLFAAFFLIEMLNEHVHVGEQNGIYRAGTREREGQRPINCCKASLTCTNRNTEHTLFYHHHWFADFNTSTSINVLFFSLVEMHVIAECVVLLARVTWQCQPGSSSASFNFRANRKPILLYLMRSRSFPFGGTVI